MGRVSMEKQRGGAGLTRGAEGWGRFDRRSEGWDKLLGRSREVVQVSREEQRGGR